MKIVTFMIAILSCICYTREHITIETHADSSIDVNAPTPDFIQLKPKIDTITGKMSERFIDANKTGCIESRCSTIEVKIIMGSQRSARLVISWLYLDLKSNMFQIMARQHYRIVPRQPPVLMRTEGSYQRPLTEMSLIDGNDDMLEIKRIIKSDWDRFQLQP